MLRRVREAAGLSQRELADLVGVSHSRVSEYERGHRSPTIARLAALVEAAGGRIELRLVPPLADADRTLLELQLAMSPTQRLDALAAMARLRGRAR